MSDVREELEHAVAVPDMSSEPFIPVLLLLQLVKLLLQDKTQSAGVAPCTGLS
jgi:hypothetical protein